MLVIFDCDGVLVDSEPISNRALAETLAPLGVRLSADETMAEFMGRARPTVMARVRELVDRPLPAGFERDYEARRDERFRAELRAVAGIADAVDAIEAAGHVTCVASSGDHAKMRLTLGLTGLYERFEGRISAAADVQHGKPAPDLFLHAAARMGFEPRDCVVVEDSPVGVQAARAAGMRVLGFAGLTAPELLAGADATFADMAQLPGLV